MPNVSVKLAVQFMCRVTEQVQRLFFAVTLTQARLLAVTRVLKILAAATAHHNLINASLKTR